MNWRPPKLTATRIVVSEPVVVTDPTEFFARVLDPSALAVVERSADVRIIPLGEVIFDARTAYVHAFADVSHADVRAIRVEQGWLVDAVYENAAAEGARPVLARPGRNLCLGKAASTTGRGTAMLEARIRPYTLPILFAADANACVEFFDYYAEDSSTGDIYCIAHRVVGIRSLSHE